MDLFRCDACLAVGPFPPGRCKSCGTPGRLQAITSAQHRKIETAKSRAREGRLAHLSDDEREELEPDGRDGGPMPGDDDEPVAANTFEMDVEEPRAKTGVPVLDRVCDPQDELGPVCGDTYLIGGSPGAGKSTIMWQAIAGTLAGSRKVKALYASSGEMSRRKAAAYGRSMGVTDAVRSRLHLLETKSHNAIARAIRSLRPAIAVVDSLHGLVGDDRRLTKTASTIIGEAARSVDCTLFLIAHQTKGAKLAGPEQLQHLGDATFWLEHGTFARGEWKKLEAPLEWEHGGLVKLHPRKIRGRQAISGYFQFKTGGLMGIDGDPIAAVREAKQRRKGSLVA